MVDVLEFRMSKLARISNHYRQLGVALAPETVSGEIAAVADAFDNEVMRINRECVGRRACPCELAHSCIAVVDDRLVFQTRSTKKAA
jgi:hypothetical protein